LNALSPTPPSVRRVYFDALDRVTAGLLQSSDTVLVEVATRLEVLFALLDKRDAGGLPVRVDRNDSGLPILADVIALAQDVEARKAPTTSSHSLREKVLDQMMERRRVPRKLALQEIGRAEYAEAVSNALPIFWPEGRSLSPADEGSFQRLSWDHWDGSTNRPVFTQVWLEHREHRPFALQVYQDLARKFSGSGFTPLASAIEFDDAIEHIALKRKKRWTLGPFYSPIFMDLPPGFDPLFSDLPIEDAWMFVWHVDEVVSVGTEETKSWFLAPVRYRETYAVDTSDQLAVERGASASRAHALLSHRAHQKLLDIGGSMQTLMRGMRIHSLSANGQLFEDI
jgi:hypothetical protein